MLKMNYSATCVLALVTVITGLIMTACKDHEQYDFPGNPENKVYLRLYNQSGSSIIQTPVSSTSNVDFKFPVYSRKTAVSPVTCLVGVDTSSVRLYNQEHAATYKALPADAVVMEHNELTIPANEMRSSDSVHVTLDKSKLGNLRDSGGYLLALKLTSASGAAISDAHSTVYTPVSVLTDEDNIQEGLSESDVNGQLITDRSGWKITLGDGVSTWNDGSPESWIDDSPTSSCYLTGQGRISLTVDLGQSYTVCALRMYMSYGSTKFGMFKKGFVIDTSLDGKTWTNAGTLSADGSVVSFYKEITAEYLKLTYPGNTLYASDFNIYVK